MISPVLAIAIPTYNGSKTLGTTLESILTQLEDGVEVLISDNASTDQTREVVQAFQERFPTLRYYRNETNLGFDRNVDLAVRRAEASFVWLCSDNDLPQPGTVHKVLAVLRHHPDLGVGFVNYPNPIQLPQDVDGLYALGSDFLAASAFKSGLISSNIINRKLWEEISPEKYVGSGWIHFGFLIEALQRAPGFVFHEHGLKKIEGLPSNWGNQGSFIYVGLRLVRIFRAMPSLGYDRKTMRRAIHMIHGAYPTMIPYARATGLKLERKLLAEFFTLYGDLPSFWLRDLPLLLIPSFVYRPLLSLYQALRERNRAVG